MNILYSLISILPISHENSHLFDFNMLENEDLQILVKIC